MLIFFSLYIETFSFSHPLDQFEIIALWFYWSGMNLPVGLTIITNLTVVLWFNSFFIRSFFNIIYDKGNLNTWQYLLIEIYNLVKSIIVSNTSLKRRQYFTILFYLFLFILISNIVGLIPYSFTITSSFIITFFIALSHFNGINIIGFFKTKWETVNLLLPSGVPLAIAPFLVLIELVSYIAKVFSLSIRLFANMMSGHALLKILIGFSWGLLTTSSPYMILAILPWILVTIILFLEALIAFLQAYVFTILVAIYINDISVAH
jgi:ATP synthase subunit 6